MRRVFVTLVSCWILIGWNEAVIHAEVKPHRLFSDAMVLQQKMMVPVWGTAAAGEKVTVEFQGQKVSATAGQDGKWTVRLKPLRAGGPFPMTISGENKIQLGNVLVGEVWLCSGQSNMEWYLSRSANAEQEVANARHPMIRLFTVPRRGTDEPQSTVDAAWKETTPEAAANFSAVGYYFGRALQQKLGVPIGLINSSYGGTPAEAWTSHQTLSTNPALTDIEVRYRAAAERYPQAAAEYKAANELYEQAVAEAKQRGEKPPPRQVWPPMGPENPSRPSALYNAMIAPLVPYALRGAIWYQGESNASRAYEYRTLFSAMIEDWRSQWKQGDFPFLFVQLAPFMKIEPEPRESNWAELREAQLLTTSRVPKTGMVVITDVGEEDDIHPQQKAPVGERLAVAARAIAYGERIEYSGPIYSSMKIDGGRVVLSFKHTGRGLEARGGKLQGFTIAGPDNKFVRAEARIEGDKVVVESPQVKLPIAVRYGWANYPVVNLWNKDGLPASPFRTDDLPMLTKPKSDAASR